MLQPLEAPRWPAAPASPRWCEIRSGGRAAGPWPSPRARRQTGPSPGGQPGPVAWPSGEGDRGEEQAAVPQLLGHPAGLQPQPLPGGARSDPVGVLLDHGQVPGRNGRQRPSPGGQPGPVAWPSGEGDRGEEQAAVLQLLGHSAGRQPQPLPGGARSGPVGVLLDHGQVPGRDGSPSLSLVVRDQIRWACCWTMAKCSGGTADRAITWWATRSGGLAPRDG